MRPPPRIDTRRAGAMSLPARLSTRMVSLGEPMTCTRSPGSGTKWPLGTMTSSPRLAAHSRMLPGLRRLYSISEMPASGLLSVTWKPISSTCPRAKLSTLNAAGTRRIRAISCAAAYSGLMVMSSPISRRSTAASRKYSGLRTRATVRFAPSFFAIRQQMRLTSSFSVTAMTRSASRTPA